MKLRIIVLLLSALVMGAVLADTPVYKWVDKDGHVHYSTVPKNPNAQATDIINTGHNQAPAASSASATTTANQVPAISADDSPACKSAKESLGKYLLSDSLYTLDAKGDKTPLTKDQQAQVIQQARNEVTVACAPAGSPP